MAKREVVVAFANRDSLDVFTEDGNNYDPSKFHSHVDKSCDYNTVPCSKTALTLTCVR